MQHIVKKVLMKSITQKLGDNSLFIYIFPPYYEARAASVSPLMGYIVRMVLVSKDMKVTKKKMPTALVRPMPKKRPSIYSSVR